MKKTFYKSITNSKTPYILEQNNDLLRTVLEETNLYYRIIVDNEDSRPGWISKLTMGMINPYAELIENEYSDWIPLRGNTSEDVILSLNSYLSRSYYDDSIRKKYLLRKNDKVNDTFITELEHEIHSIMSDSTNSIKSIKGKFTEFTECSDINDFKLKNNPDPYFEFINKYSKNLKRYNDDNDDNDTNKKQQFIKLIYSYDKPLEMDYNMVDKSLMGVGKTIGTGEVRESAPKPASPAAPGVTPGLAPLRGESFEPSAAIKAAPKPASVEKATSVEGIVSAVVEGAFLKALSGFTPASPAAPGVTSGLARGGGAETFEIKTIKNKFVRNLVYFMLNNTQLEINDIISILNETSPSLKNAPKEIICLHKTCVEKHLDSGRKTTGDNINVFKDIVSFESHVVEKHTNIDQSRSCPHYCGWVGKEGDLDKHLTRHNIYRFTYVTGESGREPADSDFKFMSKSKIDLITIFAENDKININSQGGEGEDFYISKIKTVGKDELVIYKKGLKDQKGQERAADVSFINEGGKEYNITFADINYDINSQIIKINNTFTFTDVNYESLLDNLYKKFNKHLTFDDLLLYKTKIKNVSVELRGRFDLDIILNDSKPRSYNIYNIVHDGIEFFGTGIISNVIEDITSTLNHEVNMSDSLLKYNYSNTIEQDYNLLPNTEENMKKRFDFLRDLLENYSTTLYLNAVTCIKCIEELTKEEVPEFLKNVKKSYNDNDPPLGGLGSGIISLKQLYDFLEYNINNIDTKKLYLNMEALFSINVDTMVTVGDVELKKLYLISYIINVPKLYSIKANIRTAMTQGFQLWARNIITKGDEQLLKIDSKCEKDNSTSKSFAYIADFNDMCPLNYTPWEDGCCTNEYNVSAEPPSIIYNYENPNDINMSEYWLERIEMRNNVETYNIYTADQAMILLDKLREISHKHKNEDAYDNLEEINKKIAELKNIVSCDDSKHEEFQIEDGRDCDQNKINNAILELENTKKNIENKIQKNEEIQKDEEIEETKNTIKNLEMQKNNQKEKTEEPIDKNEMVRILTQLISSYKNKNIDSLLFDIYTKIYEDYFLLVEQKQQDKDIIESDLDKGLALLLKQEVSLENLDQYDPDLKKLYTKTITTVKNNIKKMTKEEQENYIIKHPEHEFLLKEEILKELSDEQCSVEDANNYGCVKLPKIYNTAELNYLYDILKNKVDSDLYKETIKNLKQHPPEQITLIQDYFKDKMGDQTIDINKQINPPVGDAGAPAVAVGGSGTMKAPSRVLVQAGQETYLVKFINEKRVLNNMNETIKFYENNDFINDNDNIFVLLYSHAYFKEYYENISTEAIDINEFNKQLEKFYINLNTTNDLEKNIDYDEDEEIPQLKKKLVSNAEDYKTKQLYNAIINYNKQKTEEKPTPEEAAEVEEPTTPPTADAGGNNRQDGGSGGSGESPPSPYPTYESFLNYWLETYYEDIQKEFIKKQIFINRLIDFLERHLGKTAYFRNRHFAKLNIMNELTLNYQEFIKNITVEEQNKFDNLIYKTLEPLAFKSLSFPQAISYTLKNQVINDMSTIYEQVITAVKEKYKSTQEDIYKIFTDKPERDHWKIAEIEYKKKLREFRKIASGCISKGGAGGSDITACALDKIITGGFDVFMLMLEYKIRNSFRNLLGLSLEQKKFLDDEFSLWENEYKNRLQQSKRMDTPKQRWNKNNKRRTYNNIARVINNTNDIIFGILFLILKKPAFHRIFLEYFIGLKNSLCRWLSKKIQFFITENPNGYLSVMLKNWYNPNYSATEPKIIANKLLNLNVMNIYKNKNNDNILQEITSNISHSINKNIIFLIELLIEEISSQSLGAFIEKLKEMVVELAVEYLPQIENELFNIYIDNLKKNPQLMLTTNWLRIKGGKGEDKVISPNLLGHNAYIIQKSKQKILTVNRDIEIAPDTKENYVVFEKDLDIKEGDGKKVDTNKLYRIEYINDNKQIYGTTFRISQIDSKKGDYIDITKDSVEGKKIYLINKNLFDNHFGDPNPLEDHPCIDYIKRGLWALSPAGPDLRDYKNLNKLYDDYKYLHTLSKLSPKEFVENIRKDSDSSPSSNVWNTLEEKKYNSFLLVWNTLEEKNYSHVKTPIIEADEVATREQVIEEWEEEQRKVEALRQTVEKEWKTNKKINKNYLDQLFNLNEKKNIKNKTGTLLDIKLKNISNNTMFKNKNDFIIKFFKKFPEIFIKLLKYYGGDLEESIKHDYNKKKDMSLNDLYVNSTCLCAQVTAKYGHVGEENGGAGLAVDDWIHTHIDDVKKYANEIKNGKGALNLLIKELNKDLYTLEIVTTRICKLKIDSTFIRYLTVWGGASETQNLTDFIRKTIEDFDFETHFLHKLINYNKEIIQSKHTFIDNIMDWFTWFKNMANNVYDSWGKMMNAIIWSRWENATSDNGVFDPILATKAVEREISGDTYHIYREKKLEIIFDNLKIIKNNIELASSNRTHIKGYIENYYKHYPEENNYLEQNEIEKITSYMKKLKTENIDIYYKAKYSRFDAGDIKNLNNELYNYEKTLYDKIKKIIQNAATASGPKKLYDMLVHSPPGTLIPKTRISEINTNKLALNATNIDEVINNLSIKWENRYIYIKKDDFKVSINLAGKENKLNGGKVGLQHAGAPLTSQERTRQQEEEIENTIGLGNTLLISDDDVKVIDDTIKLLEEYFSKGSLEATSSKNRNAAIHTEKEAENWVKQTLEDGLRMIGSEKLNELLNEMDNVKAETSIVINLFRGALAGVTSDVSSVMDNVWKILKNCVRVAINNAIGANSEAMILFSNAKIFYNAIMSMPECIDGNMTIPGVIIRNNCWDPDSLAWIHTGFSNAIDDKKYTFDYVNPDPQEPSFFDNVYEENIENTLLLTDNIRKDESFILDLWNIYKKRKKEDSNHLLSKWREKHNSKRRECKLEMADYINVGISIGLAMVIGCLLYLTGYVGVVSALVFKSMKFIYAGIQLKVFVGSDSFIVFSDWIKRITDVGIKNVAQHLNVEVEKVYETIKAIKEDGINILKEQQELAKQYALSVAGSTKGTAIALNSAITNVSAGVAAAKKVDKMAYEFTQNEKGGEKIDDLAFGIWLGVYRPFYFKEKKNKFDVEILTYIWVDNPENISEKIKEVYSPGRIDTIKKASGKTSIQHGWLQEEINEIDVFPCHTILWTPNLNDEADEADKSDMAVKFLISKLREIVRDFINTHQLCKKTDDKEYKEGQGILKKLLEEKKINIFQHYIVLQEIYQRIEREQSGMFGINDEYTWANLHDPKNKNKQGIPPTWQDVIRKEKQIYDKTIKKYFSNKKDTKDLIKKHAVQDLKHEHQREIMKNAGKNTREAWIKKSTLIEAAKFMNDNISSRETIIENLKYYKFSEKEINEIEKEASYDKK